MNAHSEKEANTVTPCLSSGLSGLCFPFCLPYIGTCEHCWSQVTHICILVLSPLLLSLPLPSLLLSLSSSLLCSQAPSPKLNIFQFSQQSCGLPFLTLKQEAVISPRVQGSLPGVLAAD